MWVAVETDVAYEADGNPWRQGQIPTRSANHLGTQVQAMAGPVWFEQFCWGNERVTAE